MEISYIHCRVEKYLSFGGKFGLLHGNSFLNYFLALYNQNILGEIIFRPESSKGAFPLDKVRVIKLKSFVEGKGIGRTLVEKVEDFARKNNFPLIVLDSRNNSFWRNMRYNIDGPDDFINSAWKKV